MTWEAVIEGKPITKKNSQRIVYVHGRPLVLPSSEYKAWERMAVPQLREQWGRGGPLTEPVALSAVFYRERRSGDLGNFLNALCDALERAEVVENDKLIEHFVWCAVDKDASRPRTWLCLETLEGMQ